MCSYKVLFIWLNGRQCKLASVINQVTDMHFFFETLDQCGRRLVQKSRIINGVKADRGDWPWQVAVYSKGLFVCGASIINPSWILSAAHCFNGNPTPSDYYVVLGDHDRYLRLFISYLYFVIIFTKKFILVRKRNNMTWERGWLIEDIFMHYFKVYIWKMYKKTTQKTASQFVYIK